jgi:hypothetical protein
MERIQMSEAMKFLSIIFLLLVFSSCAVTKKFNPNKKYGPDQLKSDYALFRNILEKEHPGLYWYTSVDSMNYYFDKGERMLRDSLTETGFRTVLSYVLSQIKCGHTSVRPSKAYARRGTGRYFPLVIKTWPDTSVITLNLSRKDSNVVRGSLLTAINNIPMSTIIDSMFEHLSADGYNLTHKYQTLSNRGVFGSTYTALYGARQKYKVSYIDTAGNSKSDSVSLYSVSPDTSRRLKEPIPQPSKKERKRRLLLANRSLRFDTALSLAVMDVSTFTKGFNLSHFFRSSFRTIRKNNTQNLVIDLRSNGGGSVTNSNLLTKFIADKSFKIADSLYALNRTSSYKKYQKDRISNFLFLLFMTRKKKDGHFHFRYFERKKFKPKRKNHFDGPVYVLTGGNTFSASTLFAQKVKQQDNVFIVGEETGGGAYGNNAWLIPDVTLPITKVRFRLPLFRLVIDADIPKNGRGIMPEVEVLPSVKDIRHNVDYKMEKVIELVKESQAR